MIIIGAGYSGLLAGCIFKDSAIIEKGSYSECRDKHQAVFRMKTDRIAKYLGIEFKKGDYRSIALIFKFCYFFTLIAALHRYTLNKHQK